MRKVVILFAVAGVLVSGMASGAAAEEAPLKLMPSTKLIRWEVELAGGKRVIVTAREGEMVRLANEDNGIEVSIKPVLKRDGSGAVVFQVFEPTPGRARLKKVDAVELVAGVQGHSRGIGFTLLPARESLRPTTPAAAKAPAVAADTLVQWELTLANGKRVGFVSREGDMARITLEGGESFGFVPRARESGSVAMPFEVFNIQAGQDGREQVRQVDALDVEPGAEYFLAAVGGSAVRILGIQRSSDGALRFTQQAARAGEPPPDPTEQLRCCVTCGGTTACGCAVMMDCGNCCMGPCCPADM